MKKMCGWQIFTKEEMNNENTKIVISEMIQNNIEQMARLKKNTGLYELVECQNNALYNALSALAEVDHES